MRSFKRLTRSLIGIILFVVLPSFFIISSHLQKNFPGNDFIVADATGSVSVRYQIEHSLKAGPGENIRYMKNSNWLPLRPGMHIGSGALIKVGKNSSADILRNDQMALRIMENSQVRLRYHKTGGQFTDAGLESGKVLCRVEKKKKSSSDGEIESLKVVTPQAAVFVRGTTFSVDFHPDKHRTQVEVLEGVVGVKSQKFRNREFKIPDGKSFQLFPHLQLPIIDMLNAAAIEELSQAQGLKIAPKITDRWDDALLYVSGLPLYRKALTEITRYEMKVFIRAIKFFSPLRWNNAVPASIREVELEDGDYQDPWDTDYLYEKLSVKKAVLLSAGPDRVYHTADDILMPIVITD